MRDEKERIKKKMRRGRIKEKKMEEKDKKKMMMRGLKRMMRKKERDEKELCDMLCLVLS